MKKLVLMGALALGLMSFNLSADKAESIYEVESGGTCTTVAQLAYNLAISEGADHPTAVQYSNIVYNNCIRSTHHQ